AERRAAALALDRDLLRDLLGSDELRDLLDADAIAEVELELQRLAPGGRRARSPDDMHDLLLDLGDLTEAELVARVEGGDATVAARRPRLLGDRRGSTGRIAGEARGAAAEDAARYRDALGAADPRGLPGAFLEPVAEPMLDLLARFARTHAPFTVA